MLTSNNNNEEIINITIQDYATVVNVMESFPWRSNKLYLHSHCCKMDTRLSFAYVKGGRYERNG